MKKLYVNKEDLNSEKLKTGRVSYKRLVERYVGDIVLCNNITDVDNEIWDNVDASDLIDEDGDEMNDLNIYQYYLCNVGEWEKEQLKGTGVILSYSNVLDCDVLMVQHFGTSWDCKITDIEWTENLEEA
mgnify:CR=1 FL=1